jgi:flagellar basal body-associated protein FliL
MKCPNSQDTSKNKRKILTVLSISIILGLGVGAGMGYYFGKNSNSHGINHITISSDKNILNKNYAPYNTATVSAFSSSQNKVELEAYSEEENDDN